MLVQKAPKGHRLKTVVSCCLGIYIYATRWYKVAICLSSFRERKFMKWLIRGLYLSLLAVVVGGFFFLMYGEIPPPVAKIEKVIPIDYFKRKQSVE